jgi:uncharacterized protein YqeY
MTLKTRVGEALKQAMRDKEADRLSTLRLINAAIKDREIAARGSGDDDSAGVGDAEVTEILAKMIKQRQDSIRAYEEGGRLELAERERAEITVIEEFLPKRLDEAETETAIESAIRKTGATTIRDMGRVMAELKAEHAGRMDFAVVGPKVKARLG